MAKRGNRRFRGYAAIDEWKALLWGSLSVREEDAAAKFDRHNPGVEGHERQAKICPVTIHVHDEE